MQAFFNKKNQKFNEFSENLLLEIEFFKKLVLSFDNFFIFFYRHKKIKIERNSSFFIKTYSSFIYIYIKLINNFLLIFKKNQRLIRYLSKMM